jgi:serine/threonine protein kinase
VSSQTLDEPDLYLGLLAVRNEFVNLSELKHCVEVRRKLFAKSNQTLDLGEVLVQQRYLTPQDLEYLHMLKEAESQTDSVDIKTIEAEFDAHVAELKPGSNFDVYRIEQELGRGGMGIVFRAFNTENDEECALKILIGGKNATVRDIERFKKEATVMAPLIHEGIVKIHEVGRHKGLDFIAMEFVEGVSMKELVGEKALDSDVALIATYSAAEAVGFMHSHGIIHRDIKPENILIRPDGSAVLMDFGLAGWDKIEILAGRGSIGTPMYQPPEQADVNGPFGKISPASDVYGLGATLYYLLTSRHPFLGRSVKEVREKIKTRPPDPIRQLNPKIHAAAEALCLRCLKKRQTERFQTPKELNAHIKKVLRLLSAEGKGDKPLLRLKRRVAAAMRRRSEGTGKVGKRSDMGKVKRTGKGTKGPKAIKRSSGSGRKTATAPRKSKSGQGSTGGPRRNAAARQAAGDNTNSVLVAVGVVAVVLVVVIGFIAFSL